MNTPNKLTLARMIMTPFLLASLLLDFPYHFTVAAVLFAIASVTDYIDGNLARKYNQVTSFGKVMDPIADKILVIAALLGLMQIGYCSPWVIFIILGREFIVTSVRILSADQNKIVPANILGKMKTAFQMVSLVLIFILLECQNHFQIPYLEVTIHTMLWISAVLTFTSGISYVAGAKLEKK